MGMSPLELVIVNWLFFMGWALCALGADHIWKNLKKNKKSNKGKKSSMEAPNPAKKTQRGFRQKWEMEAMDLLRWSLKICKNF
jgi:hypothetical protein